MLRPVVQTLGANEKLPIRTPHSYLRVLLATAPLTLRMGTGGKLDEEIDGITASIGRGLWYRRRPNQPMYDYAQVVNGATPQQVVLLIGDDEAGYDALNVDIDDDASRLLGIVYGTLGQVAQELLNGVNALVVACKGTLGTIAQVVIGGVNALQVTPRGIAYGASFASETVLASGGTETAVEAAANVNGMILWRASIMTAQNNGAGSSKIGLLAKAGVPASNTDGDVILSAGVYCSTGVGSSQDQDSMEGPVFIAAGKGLYYRNGGASLETMAYRHLQYTLL